MFVILKRKIFKNFICNASTIQREIIDEEILEYYKFIIPNNKQLHGLIFRSLEKP